MRENQLLICEYSSICNYTGGCEHKIPHWLSGHYGCQITKCSHAPAQTAHCVPYNDNIRREVQLGLFE